MVVAVALEKALPGRQVVHKEDGYGGGGGGGGGGLGRVCQIVRGHVEVNSSCVLGHMVPGALGGTLRGQQVE